MQTGAESGHRPRLGSRSALSLASELTMRCREACKQQQTAQLADQVGCPPPSPNPGLRDSCLIFKGDDEGQGGLQQQQTALLADQVGCRSIT